MSRPYMTAILLAISDLQSAMPTDKNTITEAKKKISYNLQKMLASGDDAFIHAVKHVANKAAAAVPVLKTDVAKADQIGTITAEEENAPKSEGAQAPPPPAPPP